MKKILKYFILSILAVPLLAFACFLLCGIIIGIYNYDSEDYLKEYRFFTVKNHSEKILSLEFIYEDSIVYNKNIKALSEDDFELKIYSENDYEIKYTIDENSGSIIYNSYDYLEDRSYISVSPEYELKIKDGDSPFLQE